MGSGWGLLLCGAPESRPVPTGADTWQKAGRKAEGVGQKGSLYWGIQASFSG